MGQAGHRQGPKTKGGRSPAACLGCLVLVIAAAGLSTWFVLATQNDGTAPTGPVLTPYERAMNTLTANCTESPDSLEGTISATYATLAKAGKSVTVDGVALGLSYMTAGNPEPMDCAAEFADYLAQQGVK
jgi:hypothetical protein